jgi:aminoglycoside phosphotransferase
MRFRSKARTRENESSHSHAIPYLLTRRERHGLLFEQMLNNLAETLARERQRQTWLTGVVFRLASVWSALTSVSISLK